MHPHGTTPDTYGPGVVFATTHWSVVLQAGQPGSEDAAKALADLCTAYWYPLYAYVRRCGYSHEDAEDLTQEFFARMLAKDYLAAVRPEKGRFRWFLLCAIKRFLINERERAARQKRGGGRSPIPFDGERANERYGAEAADHLGPDKLFDRAWAADLIEGAQKDLDEEYRLEGKSGLFSALKLLLSGDRDGETYAQIGTRLKMSEGAVKVAVHRMRRRYRDLLREQVAQTVTNREQLEEELRDLLAVFSR